MGRYNLDNLIEEAMGIGAVLRCHSKDEKLEEFIEEIVEEIVNKEDSIKKDNPEKPSPYSLPKKPVIF